MYYKTHYQSPLGDIIIASDDHKITGLWIGKEYKEKYIKYAKDKDIIETDNHPILREGLNWLDDYFASKKPSIERLPLGPAGTEFRQLVWKILMTIPYGKLTTYGDIAKEVAKHMGRERMSAQAVGGAVGHNPISIIIPCHRVVGKDGNLTGYGGGMDIKVSLLDHEGIDMAKLYIPNK